MPLITRDLLRKRAEHNEGMISTLEEISLHQEELESINEVLGMTCRKLKILYLQNNIISKMENLFHMKDLVYLNLALNNVTKIEGLHNCEFLGKLDLTVNFIDLDELKDSIDHLQSRTNLHDLYMMGNPSEHNWPNFKHYVIAKLPQLQNLDGTEITRSMQIQARQKLPALEVSYLFLFFPFHKIKKWHVKTLFLLSQIELEKLASAVRIEKRAKATVTEQTKAAPSITTYANGVTIEDVDEEAEGNADQSQEMTDNTPETRVRVRFQFTLQLSILLNFVFWHVHFACFYVFNKK